MPNPAVLVSIPTRENIHAETVGWLLNQIKHATTFGITVGVHIIYSSYPLELQRNHQMYDFLKPENKNYDYLFLLDSDCVPQEGTLEKLIDYDLDIVASVAPSMIKGGHCFTAAWERDDVEPGQHEKFRMLEVNNENAHGLQEVDGTGATGVLIKRHVVEAIEPPWFKMLFDGEKMELGEDYYFFRKAKEAGFKVYADFDLRQRHYKSIAL